MVVEVGVDGEGIAEEIDAFVVAQLFEIGEDVAQYGPVDEDSLSVISEERVFLLPKVVEYVLGERFQFLPAGEPGKPGDGGKNGRVVPINEIFQ